MASALQVWGKLLGLNKVVVEGVEFLEDQRTLVVSVRVARRAQGRCSECGRRCPGYDQGYGRRQWRGLDLGTTLLQLEADTPRVKCPEHGVISASVPWARRGSRFTREFEDQCSWLAVNTSRSSVADLLRVAWRTVGRIVERVMSEARKATDLLAGLRRIGIDELSYRKGHKYATVVVDHDTGRLVWMAPGRNKETVDRFFDELGPSRCASLELVSADGATWIDDVVQKRAPQAERCLDPFHVVQWATKALDDVRRGVWNDLRHGDAPGQAKDLKGARWALWKNPENLSSKQRRTLAWIAKVNAPLYRAYLLKEALRSVFHERTLPRAMARLEAWLAWAIRCRLEPFTKLARSIKEYRSRIEATLLHGLSNAIVESRNTQLRLLHRIAHGFHDVQAFIGLAMLKLGGLCPPLPGRIRPTEVS
jgi:transposase